MDNDFTLKLTDKNPEIQEGGDFWRRVHRLFMDLFPRRETARKVLLVMYDNDMKIVKARRTQAGWIARWIESEDQWSLLLPGGRVEGTTLVKRWLPHSGWGESELARGSGIK